MPGGLVAHAKLRRVIRFGDCAVDVAAREVRLHGRVQHLRTGVFDVLAHLLAHHERVVAKEELLDEVWGDRFVSESAVRPPGIEEIRRAIGDDGTQQRLVRNIRGAATGSWASSLPTRGGARAPIIGRSGDVTAVVELLGSSRLVTLAGPGGVGKTRLAVEVAANLAGRVGGGSAFVDLAVIVDPDAIVPALLHCVGIRADVGDPAAALRTPRRARRRRRAGQLRAPRRRRRLRGRDRHGCARSSTDPGDEPGTAGRDRRAGMAGHAARPPGGPQPVPRTGPCGVAGSVSAEVDVVSVDRIVDAVDRLPLAIEMAAARLSSTGLDELATIVATRLDLLRSPVRGTTDRHRTLTTLIAWSEELLDAGERTAFAELAVFAGPVSMVDLTGVLERRRCVRSRLPAGRPVARGRRRHERSGPLPAAGDRTALGHGPARRHRRGRTTARGLVHRDHRGRRPDAADTRRA